MFSILFKNSYFSQILMKFEGIFNRVNLWIVRMHKDSYTNKLIKEFCEGAKINFRYSFIVKITEMSLLHNIYILKTSKFVNWLLNLCKTCKLSMINYIRTSDIVNSVIIIRKELNISPIKTGSIIIITALLTNIFFSILLEKRIMILGWFVQFLLLIIGLGIIFCSSKWEEIKVTSAVINYINRYK